MEINSPLFALRPNEAADATFSRPKKRAMNSSALFSVADEIEKLNKLKQAGSISDAEFMQPAQNSCSNPTAAGYRLSR